MKMCVLCAKMSKNWFFCYNQTMKKIVKATDKKSFKDLLLKKEKPQSNNQATNIASGKDSKKTKFDLSTLKNINGDQIRSLVRFTGIALLIAAAAIFGMDMYISSQNSSYAAEVVSLVEEEAVIQRVLQENPQATEAEVIVKTFETITNDLLAVNSDYAGWIEVGGTNINYPIVRGTDNDFYLRHNFQKRAIRHGAIFMDYRNAKDYSDKHVVIYGHHMRDGTMFHALDRYKNQSYLTGRETIKIRTLTGYRTYRIFSVYTGAAELTKITVNANNRDLNELMQRYKDRSIYNIDVNITGATQMLTLASCNYDFDDGRVIIHAILESVDERTGN